VLLAAAAFAVAGMTTATDRAAVARFETVLTGGSRRRFSIPRAAGEAWRIVLSNAGDHLHIAKPNAAVSAR
jgi:hypothetical protein